ncbi:MAG: hypothetical protein AB1650_01480 [Candidatus Omnitrophota bacterium]
MPKSFLIPNDKNTRIAVKAALVVFWLGIIYIVVFKWTGLSKKQTIPAVIQQKKAAIEVIKDNNEIVAEYADLRPAPRVSWLHLQEQQAQEEARKARELEERGIVFDSRKDAGDAVFLNDDSTEVLGEDKIFSAKGSRTILSKEPIQVDPDKQYQLSLEAMTAGEIPGDVYIGLACYDSRMRPIRDREVYRSGRGYVIDEAGSEEILMKTDVYGWSGENDFAGRKMLGFYFDGETKHLPDYILENYEDYYDRDPKQGAYLQIRGNRITLNYPLPDEILEKIIPETTVIDNHYGGSVYHFVAARREPVPTDEWALFQSDVISGEAFNDDLKHFRPGTRYVRIVILSNYYTPRFEQPRLGKQKQIFRNIIFREVLPEENKDGEVTEEKNRGKS